MANKVKTKRKEDKYKIVTRIIAGILCAAMVLSAGAALIFSLANK